MESALFRLYFSLFEGGNLKQIGAAYYCLDSFGAKCKLVDATATAVLEGEELAAWKFLSKGMQAASSDRNVLAHLPAVAEFAGDGSIGLVLQHHFYVPTNLVRGKKRKYDATGCEAVAEEFLSLVGRLEAFVNARAGV